MVKTISTAILIVTVCCAYRNEDPVKPYKPCRHNRDMYFTGPVKSVQGFNYKHDPADSGSIGYPCIDNFKFDSAGNLVERIDFKFDGELSSRSVYLFNKAGYYTEWIGYDKDSSPVIKHNYEFDEHNNMIKDVQCSYRDGKVLIDTQVLYYNEHGNMIELCTPAESFHILNTYKYNAMGLPVTKERIDVYKGTRMRHPHIERRTGSHEPYIDIRTNKYRYTYKYIGNTREETVYTDNYTGYSTNVWSRNNRILRWHGVDDYTHKPFNNTYKYDASGFNVTEYKEEKDGIVNNKNSYRCEYMYDKKGNWIKKTVTALDGKFRAMVERKIEYY